MNIDLLIFNELFELTEKSMNKWFIFQIINTASLPGPSSTTYNFQDKATENFSRLCQLIVTICSDLFRIILSYDIKPHNLRTALDTNKKTLNKFINTQQKQLLYPGKGKASLMAKDLDFSVLYVLLRNICSIQTHKNGWGFLPDPSDNSTAACIDRIRIQRNLISGHSTTGSMDNASFHNCWIIVENSVVEIEKQLTGGDMFKRAVNALYLCELSPSGTKRYIEEFTRTFKSKLAWFKFISLPPVSPERTIVFFLLNCRIFTYQNIAQKHSYIVAMYTYRGL